jgi:hypothetical protein
LLISDAVFLSHGKVGRRSSYLPRSYGLIIMNAMLHSERWGLRKRYIYCDEDEELKTVSPADFSIDNLALTHSF